MSKIIRQVFKCIQEITLSISDDLIEILLSGSKEETSNELPWHISKLKMSSFALCHHKKPVCSGVSFASNDLLLVMGSAIPWRSTPLIGELHSAALWEHNVSICPS